MKLKGFKDWQLDDETAEMIGEHVVCVFVPRERKMQLKWVSAVNAPAIVRSGLVR